ncbi:MAG TPA: hypothetical protein VG841_02165 [Caulobacterales bacterium]|nr:hypothetical protein [Caulobacterales bacterium]
MPSSNPFDFQPFDKDDEARPPPREGRSLIGVLALFVGLIWLVAAPIGALALLGPEQFMAQPPLVWAGIAAGALLPAVMVWFSGAAATEGARARAEASRLAYAAERLLAPDPSAKQSVQNVAATVRNEINTLDNALEHTMKRLAEINSVIGKQSEAVEDMAQKARAGAGQMILGMDRERADLMKISQDLTAQAQAIGDSISRHTRIVAEAARLAEAEVQAADQALDHRINSFGAAASLITDRTQSLAGAAQASADSALRLENALSNALDVLSKATSLTDAARQSAEQATLAANSTAGAVRETTIRAIDEARRAAELIRGETANIEQEAEIALEKLREAAEAARTAAIGARVAAEDQARMRPAPTAPPEWRAPQPDPYQQPPHRRTPEAEPHRAQQPPRRDPPADFGERPQAPAGGGAWTWRDLLANVDDNQASEPARPASAGQRRGTAPAEDAVARLTRAVSEPHPANTLPAAEVIERAGLRVHEVFSASGLERVAQRARNGTQARRRAVRDAAPHAVDRLSEYLARDGAANHEAMLFLQSEGARIAELLSRGRAAMGAEATRAFLLLDAAAG